jgi:hypothetical protein
MILQNASFDNSRGNHITLNCVLSTQYDITEILLKVALNTRTHNHSSHYSLLIMCGSTFREILVSLQKRLLIVTDQNLRLILLIFSFELWPAGSTGFSSHFVIPVLFMSSSVTQLILLWFLCTYQPELNWQMSNQHYIIVMCCFSAKHAILRRKSKDW